MVEGRGAAHTCSRIRPLRQREGYYCVAYWVWGELAVGVVAAEAVYDEFFAVHYIGCRRGHCAASVRYGCAVEGEQHLSCSCVHGVELAVAFAEEGQVSCDQHPGFSGLWDLDLPHDFSGGGIGGATNTED